MAATFVLASNQTAALSSSLGVLQNIAGATLMTWVKPVTLTGTERMMLYFSTGTANNSSRAAITMRIGTGFRCSGRRLDADTVQTVDSTTVPATGTIYHVAGVLDWTNTALRIYVNGVQENSVTVAGWTGNSSNTASLGAQMACRTAGDNATEIDAILDDPRVYNRVLTANEIQDIASARGRDAVVNGMVERWKLMDNSTGSAITTARSIGSNQGGAVAANSPLYSAALNTSTRRRRH